MECRRSEAVWAIRWEEKDEETSDPVTALICLCFLVLFFFFFNDTATTEIYTLSLHDALPICLMKDFGEVLPWESINEMN